MRSHALTDPGSPARREPDYSPTDARWSPVHFARRVAEMEGRQYFIPPHIALLNDVILRVAFGELEHVIICLPPRHGKSELASASLPPWLLGRWPDRRVILAGYNSEFATGFGRICRDYMEQYGEQLFGVTVDPASSAANRWGIRGHRGGMLASGVGGTITGFGADLMIVDDAIKNPVEAMSKARRDAVWEWFTQAAYTRVHEGGGTIVIATRWHEDDLIGRLLSPEYVEDKAMRDMWTVVNLPAIAGDDDILGREPGELLWPSQFGQLYMDRRKALIGERMFNSLYQQKPMKKSEGALWLPEWIIDGRVPKTDLAHIREQCTRVVVAVDPADSPSGETGIVVAGLAGNDVYIIADYTVSGRPEIWVPRVVQAYERFNANTVVAEANYGGGMVQDLLRRETRDAARLVPVKMVRAKYGKEIRAEPVTLLYARGIVHHVGEHEALEGQLCTWVPGSGQKSPDRLDACVYAVIELVPSAGTGNAAVIKRYQR